MLLQGRIVVPSNDGFKFGEHLSRNGLTNEIISKSVSSIRTLGPILLLLTIK